MDIRFTFPGFCLLLHLISSTVSSLQNKDCRMCKPGYYVSRQCTPSHDTVCKPCSKGTFSPDYSLLEQCSTCSSCDLGEFVMTKCTPLSDTVCESCSAVSDIISQSEGTFAKECLQHRNDDPSVAGLSPVIDPSGVILQDGRLVDLGYDSYESSGVPEEKLPYEGSGATVVDEVDVWPTETVEGSGTIPETEVTENATYVILPETSDTDGSDVTTPRMGSVDIDGGIKLENTTDSDQKDVVLSSNVPKVSTTTTRNVVLHGGDGILLPEPGQEDDAVDINLTGDHPHAGARKNSERHSGGHGVGTLVIVGLVSALIFFILGFFISRYWSSRRERTFNVLEAERRNGQTVECSGLEYKDPEKNGKNHYDEIPANSRQNGRNGVNGNTPIYTKPLKRENVLPVRAAPNTKPSESNDGQPLNGGTPHPVDRPTSVIRYIDEDTEEAETDRLLPSSSTGSDVTDKRTPTTSESDTSRGEHDVSDEHVPMLTRGGPTNVADTSS